MESVRVEIRLLCECRCSDMIVIKKKTINDIHFYNYLNCLGTTVLLTYSWRGCLLKIATWTCVFLRVWVEGWSATFGVFKDEELLPETSPDLTNVAQALWLCPSRFPFNYCLFCCI